MIDPLEKRKEVKKRLRRLEGLPTLPPIVQKLNALIEDERSSLNQMADLIEKDQVITTKVLRLANSAFYGFPRKVSTVHQAMMLLGINVLKILIMTSSIFEIIHQEDIGLWEHSVGVAACAKIVAEFKELSDPQELATAGLLHDLGRVVQLIVFKEECEEVKKLVQSGIAPLEAELRVFGIDHAEIGSYIMSQWNLPERLVEMVNAHHDLSRVKKYKKESALLHLSDLFVHARGYGETTVQTLPPFDARAVNVLKIALSDVREIYLKLEPRLYELKFFTEELKRELS